MTRLKESHAEVAGSNPGFVEKFCMPFFVFRRCPSDEESIPSVVDKILGRNSEVAGSNPGKIEKLFCAKMISF